jgi:hypothetical protein
LTIDLAECKIHGKRFDMSKRIQVYLSKAELLLLEDALNLIRYDRDFVKERAEVEYLQERLEAELETFEE